VIESDVHTDNPLLGFGHDFFVAKMGIHLLLAAGGIRRSLDFPEAFLRNHRITSVNPGSHRGTSILVTNTQSILARRFYPNVHSIPYFRQGSV